MKYWFLTIAVFLGSLLATAVIGFFLGVLLVGPHSDILPSVLHIPVGLMLWLFVLGLPLWLARLTYRKLQRRKPESFAHDPQTH